MDAGLRAWLAAHHPGGGVAVVALGGYARRELCPRSDVDLLLLHDGWGRHDLERLVRSLCYPLWDAGLSVGHAVHTPRAAVAAMSGRLDSATALTDRRLVAGDPGLADALASRVTRWLRRNGARMLDEVAAAGAQRRQDAHPGMLEPDLKAGPGGLRDLHALRWASAVVLGEVGIDPLVGAGYVSVIERRQLAEARRTLLTARCALHLVEGRTAGDVLRLEAQDEVAERLSLEGGDALLREVGIAMRTVAHVHGRASRALRADAAGGRRRPKRPPVGLADGVALADGVVEVDPGRPIDEDPGLGLRAVAAAAALGAHLGRRSCAQLAHQLQSGRRLSWGPGMVASLLAALGAGSCALPALRDADHVGLLAALLPDWPRVRGRRQRNPYHRYDLDTHLLMTVVWLRSVAEGALAREHAEVWSGLGDPEAVLLAAFLHDVGKAWPGDHSAVGAAVAEHWLAHMGVAAERRRRVVRLVAEHLLLPDAATRRDIDDEAEVVAVAERAGDLETLDGLYLLSLADGRATGPSACSPWKEDLLARLHARAARVLADDAVGGALCQPSTVAAAVRDLAGGDPDAVAAVDALLAGVPPRYLVAASPEQCLEHARLLAALRRTGTPAVAVRPAGERTSVLSVACADRLGLVADCAGLVAASGLDVHEARAFTLPAGETSPAAALDWFVIAAALEELPEALPERLAGAAAGHLDVPAALTSRRRGRAHRPRALPTTADEVDVRIERAGETGRVEVHAPDTPGLVSNLARALAEAGIDVRGARVATLGPVARDVFFVRWPAGVDLVRLERVLLAAGSTSTKRLWTEHPE